MFEIKYRIVDDFQQLKVITADDFNDEWNQITGFFQICFNESQEGSYYHDNPLADGEEGGELLDYWFEKLLQVIILFKSDSEYVAIKEIETVNRWLEFKKQGDNILINVAVDDSCQNNKLLITEKGEFSYITPLDFGISYKCLEEQIVLISSKFLNELKCMNQKLCETKMFVELSQKIRNCQEVVY